jgi:autotransporter-associated beta strand protein
MAAFFSVAALCGTAAHAQRVMGLDTSSVASGSSGPSQALWNTAFSQGYRFAFVRASRGGTVADSFNDPAVFNNLTRATTAGLLAGTYHFTRPDSTTAHTGDDEAQHYMNYAGVYMKPGYLLPVVDAEALLNGSQNVPGLTAWLLDMVDSIEAKMHITPLVYMNTSYANDQLGKSLAFTGSTPRTYQWLARPGSNGLTGNPPVPAGYPDVYGMWDPAFTTKTNSREPAIKPWVFWQQTLDTTPAGLFHIDVDYANGNIEFVKDSLVPALYDDWDGAGAGVPDGNWTSLANWNSDNPIYNGTVQNGPAPRLPNSLDWVKLQYSGGGTVTLSSGNQSIRKLYTQQPLNITGGSLSIGYIPGSGGQFNVPSEFKAAVTISGAAAYSAHTTQVDGGGGVFNINGGTVTFSDMQLQSHASNSGKIVMGGSATFAQTGGAGTSLIRSTGTLAQAGSVTLSAGNQTFNVNNGTANVDLQVRTSTTGAGRLVKGGAGTMLLSNNNTYAGGTTISAGVLDIAADNRLGAVPASPQADNIILDGGTLRSGAQINSVSLTNAGSGYTTFPTLTINGAGTDSLAASANVLSRISSIAVTSGGSNYVNQSSAPSPGSAGTFVDIVGGGGTGATAFATVSGGVVTGITVTNIGSGYTSMPTIFISSTISGGSLPGSGATANVSGITLQNITLNDGGFDYTSPTISLTGGGGSGATATATPSPNFTLASNRGIQLTSNGGTFNQAAGTTLTVGGVISSTGNGTLTKSGTGVLALTADNTYSGPTTVSTGQLSLSGANASLGTGDVTVLGTVGATALVIESGVTNAIDDNATVNLMGGLFLSIPDAGFANLGVGVNEFISALFLGGVQQPNGTYGATGSGAQHIDNEYFAGIGMFTVGPVGVAGDFNNDGQVDAGDYVTWKKNEGTNNALANDNGLGTPIGPAHYDLWRANFGNPPGGGSTLDSSAVPEPTSVGLLLIGIAAMLYRRRVR